MAWSVARAKQRFSRLLEDAAKEPQTILYRKRLVAVMMSADAFREFTAWRDIQRRSVGAAFAELRSLAAESGYRLEVPMRRNRRATSLAPTSRR